MAVGGEISDMGETMFGLIRWSVLWLTVSSELVVAQEEGAGTGPLQPAAQRLLQPLPAAPLMKNKLFLCALSLLWSFHCMGGLLH